MKKQSATILSILLLIIIVVFALLNTANVEVNLLFTRFKTPLVLLILICLLIGALVIYLLSLSNHRKMQKQLKDLEGSAKNIKDLQKQVTHLQQENQKLQKENQDLHQQLEKKTATTTTTPSAK